MSLRNLHLIQRKWRIKYKLRKMRKALEYISTGYQKLLTYEVSGTKGGYSLYGHSPAELVLTSYGLMEFKEISEVYDVEEKVLEKILGGNFLRRVSETPKPINQEALKAYTAKYRHLIRDERVRALIDEEMAAIQEDAYEIRQKSN